MSYELPPGVQVIPVDDRGRRASDIVNSYRTFVDWEELKTKWVAIRLSDGGHDGNLYDSKQEAAKHQIHEHQCYYVCFYNLVQGSRPEEMTRLLMFAEKAYDAGMRFTDPDRADGGMDILPTAQRMDDFRGRMMPALFRANPGRFMR